MRLLILSDLHREFWLRSSSNHKGNLDWDPVSRIDLSSSRPDVVVLAGDIDVGTRAVPWASQLFAGLPVIYVHGNHEGYGENLLTLRQHISDACVATGHVHHLDRRSIELEGVRFLGATLWTDFSLYGEELRGLSMDEAAQCMNDYRRIRLGSEGYPKLSPRDTARWHHEDRSWIEARLGEPFDGKTVVVTHMAPSERSIAAQFKGEILSPAFASNLDDLVEQADLWIHGHVHSSFDYQVGDRGRVVCNPLGYPGGAARTRPENPEFDPNFIVEI